jgi:hypothetical protein
MSSNEKLKCTFMKVMVTGTGDIRGESESFKVILDCVKFVIEAQGSFHGGNIGVRSVRDILCFTVAQKSVPMFVAFHVIASLGVRVWESD